MAILDARYSLGSPETGVVDVFPRLRAIGDRFRREPARLREYGSLSGRTGAGPALAKRLLPGTIWSQGGQTLRAGSQPGCRGEARGSGSSGPPVSVSRMQGVLFFGSRPRVGSGGFYSWNTSVSGTDHRLYAYWEHVQYQIHEQRGCQEDGGPECGRPSAQGCGVRAACAVCWCAYVRNSW